MTENGLVDYDNNFITHYFRNFLRFVEKNNIVIHKNLSLRF